MFDLVAVGDTTLDVFLELNEASVSCDINKEACLLCLNYADKIPVKEVTEVAGVGNAANVAVGTARLGFKTALYTVLGDDDLGQTIADHLQKEKVAKDYFVFDKKQPTNYSTVLLYEGERTILVHHEKRNYKLPDLHHKTKWIYFSSLAKDHGTMHTQLVRAIKKDSIKLGFNPGTYQLRHGLTGLKSILAVTEVLFVNKQEAQLLVGEIADFSELLRLLHKEGPKIVVITDAERGSYAFDGQHVYFQKSVKVKMKERTGAGDSYATGFISALMAGKDVPTAMKWGTVNALSVIQYIGAQQGLLKQTVIKKRVSELKSRLTNKRLPDIKLA